MQHVHLRCRAGFPGISRECPPSSTSGPAFPSGPPDSHLSPSVMVLATSALSPWCTPIPIGGAPPCTIHHANLLACWPEKLSNPRPIRRHRRQRSSAAHSVFVIPSSMLRVSPSSVVPPHPPSYRPTARLVQRRGLSAVTPRAAPLSSTSRSGPRARVVGVATRCHQCTAFLPPATESKVSLLQP